MGVTITSEGGRSIRRYTAHESDDTHIHSLGRALVSICIAFVFVYTLYGVLGTPYVSPPTSLLASGDGSVDGHCGFSWRNHNEEPSCIAKNGNQMPSSPVFLHALVKFLCVCFASGALLQQHNLRVVSESIVTMGELGIQLEQRYRNGTETKIFIERSRIHDLIINEAITANTVVSYLAFMVVSPHAGGGDGVATPTSSAKYNGDGDVVIDAHAALARGDMKLELAFSHLLPRLDDILPVYRAIQTQFLHAETRDVPKL